MPQHTRRTSVWLVLLGLAWASATPVAAQDAPPDDLRPPATVSVALGGLLSYGGGGADIRVSATLPTRERRAVELFAGISRSRDVLNTQGVYGVQVRRFIGDGPRSYRPYSSFGVMGLVTRYEEPDCLYANCEWRSSNHVLPPVLGLVGGGADFQVRQRLAIHVEAQLAFALFVPVSGRMAVGVSVPLGRPAAPPTSRER